MGQEGTRFVFGRHSGKHAVIDRIQKLGVILPEENREEVINAIYSRFQELASTKKIIEDSDLKSIAEKVIKT